MLNVSYLFFFHAFNGVFDFIVARHLLSMNVDRSAAFDQFECDRWIGELQHRLDGSCFAGFQYGHGYFDLVWFWFAHRCCFNLKKACGKRVSFLLLFVQQNKAHFFLLQQRCTRQPLPCGQAKIGEQSVCRTGLEILWYHQQRPISRFCWWHQVWLLKFRTKKIPFSISIEFYADENTWNAMQTKQTSNGTFPHTTQGIACLHTKMQWKILTFRTNIRTNTIHSDNKFSNAIFMGNFKRFAKNNIAMEWEKYQRFIITVEIIVHVCDYQNKIGSINELCGKSRSIQIY